MSNHRNRSMLLILLNMIGLICLVYFAIPYCTHDTYVANPDAMLPFEAWDGSGMILTIGLVPMIITNTSGFLLILKKETPVVFRLLFFVPSVIEMVFVLHYWITSVF